MLQDGIVPGNDEHSQIHRSATISVIPNQHPKLITIQGSNRITKNTNHWMTLMMMLRMNRRIPWGSSVADRSLLFIEAHKKIKEKWVRISNSVQSQWNITRYTPPRRSTFSGKETVHSHEDNLPKRHGINLYTCTFKN
jgi:N-acetylmuramic acid 6-phosphate (MurNAc-6-P) etherase